MLARICRFHERLFIGLKKSDCMPRRGRLKKTRKIARSTAEKIVKSEKTPEHLKKFWEEKLNKSKAEVFVLKKRKRK